MSFFCRQDGKMRGSGILVEAKIAGLAEIVSSQNYNAEIVTDGEDGVVLRDNSIDSLRKAILTLSEDNKLLDSMKYKSWMSAQKYFVENYTDEFNIQLGGNA